MAQDLTMLEGLQIRPGNTFLKPGKSIELLLANCQVVDGVGGDNPGETVYDCDQLDMLLTESAATQWSVNGVLGGNAQFGTVKDLKFGKALYTAPAKKPASETIQVSALVDDAEKGEKVLVVATITILDDLQYMGKVIIKGGGGKSGYLCFGTLALKESGPGSVTFTSVAGSLEIRYWTEECNTYNGTVPLSGGITLWTDETSRSMRNGNPYDIVFGSEPFEVSCHGIQVYQGLLMLIAPCDQSNAKSDPEYSTLWGEGTCGNMNISWHLVRQ